MASNYQVYLKKISELFEVHQYRIFPVVLFAHEYGFLKPSELKQLETALRNAYQGANIEMKTQIRYNSQLRVIGYWIMVRPLVWWERLARKNADLTLEDALKYILEYVEPEKGIPKGLFFPDCLFPSVQERIHELKPYFLQTWQYVHLEYNNTTRHWEGYEFASGWYRVYVSNQPIRV